MRKYLFVTLSIALTYAGTSLAQRPSDLAGTHTLIEGYTLEGSGECPETLIIKQVGRSQKCLDISLGNKRICEINTQTVIPVEKKVSGGKILTYEGGVMRDSMITASNTLIHSSAEVFYADAGNVEKNVTAYRITIMENDELSLFYQTGLEVNGDIISNNVIQCLYKSK